MLFSPITRVYRAHQIRRSSRYGFTLIELLVVIAIIALLAAILFPVFARARENARKSSCLNNMKQFGLGIAQYTQDFDETLVPWEGGYALASGTRATFDVLLIPYLKSPQLMQCPSDATSAKVAIPAY